MRKIMSIAVVMSMIGAALVTVPAETGCKAFGFGVATSAPALQAVITCVGDLVDAGKTPGSGTLEEALLACGVAAADVNQTVIAIEAVAATDGGMSLPSPTVAKLRAMPRGAAKK